MRTMNSPMRGKDGLDVIKEKIRGFEPPQPKTSKRPADSAADFGSVGAGTW